VDKWLYETQCVIDEPNRIISIHTTLKRLDKDAFAHSLACSSIKYGYDVCEEGIYKRSVGQRLEFEHCEHVVTVFLGFRDTYRKIYQHIIYADVLLGRDIVGVDDPAVERCVEICERFHSVLISPYLVYIMMSYFQRMKRVMTNMQNMCHCTNVSICKCVSREKLEMWG
jgi:hypothetical protein